MDNNELRLFEEVHHLCEVGCHMFEGTGHILEWMSHAFNNNISEGNDIYLKCHIFEGL